MAKAKTAKKKQKKKEKKKEKKASKTAAKKPGAAARKGARKPAKKSTREKAARAAATHPGSDIKIIPGAEVGPGGGEMNFENERVRIWDISLEPGGKSALHTHLLDYVLVQVEGEEVKTQPHPDTQGFYNRRMILETRPGDSVFIEKGGSETAINTGKTRWREIAIELK
jgi:quercetin dioxygenase-like cupin family protein